MLRLRSIVHPTDFSDASAQAFVHALRIALNAKCALTLVHVGTGGETAEWTAFPHIRVALAGWGLAKETDTPATVAKKLGVKIAKVELEAQSAVGGVLNFLDGHPADLMVLTTEGRDGVARWLRGSTAEKLARHAKTPTLFVPANARGFVDPLRGDELAQRRAARAWSLWGGQVALGGEFSPADSEGHVPAHVLQQARLELHYGYNRYFIEENQILRDCRLIPKMPVILLHGRRDLVCPLESAFTLRAALPFAELRVLPEAGHVASHPLMSAALVEAADELAARLGA